MPPVVVVVDRGVSCHQWSHAVAMSRVGASQRDQSLQMHYSYQMNSSSTGFSSFTQLPGDSCKSTEYFSLFVHRNGVPAFREYSGAIHNFLLGLWAVSEERYEGSQA